MVDVVIPTYKPNNELFTIIDMLSKQTVKVEHLILMNTEEKYFDALLSGNKRKINRDFVHVHHLAKKEFDHGKTRNAGVRKSQADIVVLMTQDAIPADEYFIENLIKPLEDETIAASYARQLPKADADITERITREFNYPDESLVKSIEDIDKYGIKTYFCSNVSCAYNRRIYNELGGFINQTIFNEDMIYAAGALKAGYKIAYSADARVYHSHNLGGVDQFHRNVDLGVSQAEHPEIFLGIKSESEGKKLVIRTIGELKANGRYGAIIRYVWVCGCRYMGFLVGKNYKKLPKWLIKRCSMTPGYF